MAVAGGPRVDFITHAFLQFRNASVPVPRVALVDFSKAYNLSAGDDRTVELVVDAERRAVITNESFVRTVEPRPVRIWVGDGLPAAECLSQQKEKTDCEGKHLMVDVAITGEATALKHCKS